ncbi:hypothetical protein AMS68_003026 [Peltaster fructicola]|uniref:Uncharacterized protein n=1 Tax=Peltaster fructicola TaxID=286661 RepID=A0A6H0XSA9_9PEZI|nr:hypothetical protein AMS68_003026 [Peltaster fructicola]
MGLVKRLVGGIGTGVGLAAEDAESRKDKQRRSYTPANSEAGEVQASSSTRPGQTGLPPSYAESVSQGSDRQLEAGPSATDDHKVQHDDELNREDSSDLDDDDDSDLTLDDLVDEDEAAWALDEYAASHAPPTYEDATTVVSEDDLIREIIAAQRAHAEQPERTKLPCPVIIPQRRPRNKSRGFVRAYAPVLQNVGIDQDTFLRFLTNFHKSTQASPWFTVVEVSSVAAHAAGPAIGFAVEAAVKAAVTAGRNIEVAHKTNNFLDRMNSELFRPVGTFAFLMKYKTDVNMPDGGEGFLRVAAKSINLTTNQIAAKYTGSDDNAVSGLANQMSMFRIASGVTEGADDLPEAAPLIFPEIDEEAARSGQSMKDKNEFVQDYLDRRAQIRFARQDPKSGLNIPEEQVQMKSKWADPDHPMFNSGVVGLLTGGYLDLKSLRTQRQEARQDRRAARYDRRQERRESKRGVRHEKRLDRHQRRVDRFESRHGIAPGSTSHSIPTSERQSASITAEEPRQRAHGHRRRHRRGKDRPIRGTLAKVMTEDVIYLMVVNLPSETELAATVEAA